MDKDYPSLNRAKRLFIDYLGNSFLMWHEGVLEEYRSFGIGTAQESAWFEELKASFLSRLSQGDYSAMGDLWQMGAQDALPNILVVSPVGNSWTKLRFAEDLWRFTDMHTSHPAEPDVIRQACKKAIEIWQDLLHSATDIDVPNDVMKIAANGRTPHDYFRDRLNSNLKRASATGI